MSSKDYFNQLKKIEGRKSLTKLSDRNHIQNMATASQGEIFVDAYLKLMILIDKSV